MRSATLTPAPEAVYLGAKFLPFLRDVHHEGWRPSQPGRASLLSRIHDALHHDLAIDPDQVTKTVLAIMAERIDAAALAKIKAATSAELRTSWPS